jgi:TolB-like protein
MRSTGRQATKSRGNQDRCMEEKKDHSVSYVSSAYCRRLENPLLVALELVDWDTGNEIEEKQGRCLRKTGALQSNVVSVISFRRFAGTC